MSEAHPAQVILPTTHGTRDYLDKNYTKLAHFFITTILYIALHFARLRVVVILRIAGLWPTTTRRPAQPAGT